MNTSNPDWGNLTRGRLSSVAITLSLLLWSFDLLYNLVKFAMAITLDFLSLGVFGPDKTNLLIYRNTTPFWRSPASTSIVACFRKNFLWCFLDVLKVFSRPFFCLLFKEAEILSLVEVQSLKHGNDFPADSFDDMTFYVWVSESGRW